MAIKLTASNNPVYVKAGATGATTIAWEMDIAAGEAGGSVNLSINGGAPTTFAVIPATAPTGSKVQTVRLGETYFFTLRRSPDNALLASLTVTVIEEDGAIFGTAVGAPLEYLINPPQRILGLRVEPSVDTVRVSFTTKHPTIPVIEVETLDGVNVGRVIPLLAGLQTAHETIVGLSEPLPQATRLRLKITVPGQSRLAGGKARDVVRAVEFTTGSRAINVLFDTIYIRADGDPMGAGDFTFQLSAYDREHTSGGFRTDYEDIDAGDPPFRLAVDIPLRMTKREVIVTAQAADDDELLRTLLLLPERGDQPGSGFYYLNGAETGWARDVISVANVEQPGLTVIPFTLDNGDHKVAFTVNGRVNAIVTPGQGYVETRPKSARASAPRIVALKGPGRAAQVVGGNRESGARIALDANGAVWLKYFAPGRAPSAPVEWRRAAAAPGGAVTLVLDAADRPTLLALDEKGEAIFWRANQAGGEWIKLGAKLAGAITAAKGRDGQLDLFGVDAAGRVLRRAFDPLKPKPAEWRRVGDGVAGNLVALPQASGVALFAIDHEGQIVHAFLRGDETPSFERIGGPRTECFGAEALVADIGGVLVSALTDERVLHVLHWREFPRGKPHRQWREKGVIDEIIPMTPIEPRSAPEGECGARQGDPPDGGHVKSVRRAKRRGAP